MNWNRHRFPVLNLSTSKSMLVSGSKDVSVLVVSSQHVLYVCSMGPYGARHASKKGYRSIFWFLPFGFRLGLLIWSKLFGCCKILVLLQAPKQQAMSPDRAWAHAELAMLLKYFSSPVLGVPCLLCLILMSVGARIQLKWSSFQLKVLAGNLKVESRRLNLKQLKQKWSSFVIP